MKEHLAKSVSSRKLIEERWVTQRPPCSLVGMSRSSLSYRARANDCGVQLSFIDPGKPAQIACTENVNGRSREKCLNRHRVMSVREATDTIVEKSIHRTTERPCSSLKYRTPEAFVEKRPFDNTQWAPTLEPFDGSTPTPIARAAE